MQGLEEKIAKYRQIYRGALLEDVMPFWLDSDLLDRKYGGYMTSVDQQGKLYNEDKSVWFQGRCLWTFSALCRLYGETPAWREAAECGKTFLETYCMDTDGKMFFQVMRNGQPLRKRRYMFSESFYVVGMAEYGVTFGSADALSKAAHCFDKMLEIYHTPEKNPFQIPPKSYRNERSAALPMVLVSCAQVLRRCLPFRADHYSAVVKEMADDILQYHYKPARHCVLETVYADGSFIDTPTGRTINPGHSCENSWFLMNEAAFSKNEELLSAALDILNGALEWGWDKENGGLLYFVDVAHRPCEQLEWDMKLWWVHNEALIATLTAYGLTGNEVYWNWFERIHEYAFSHFVDSRFGEWYGYLHRDGTVSHEQKGSLWKGPYHLPRCLMICDKLLQALYSGLSVPYLL